MPYLWKQQDKEGQKEMDRQVSGTDLFGSKTRVSRLSILWREGL